jgi:hypothetical protein
MLPEPLPLGYISHVTAQALHKGSRNCKSEQSVTSEQYLSAAFVHMHMVCCNRVGNKDARAVTIDKGADSTQTEL